MAARIKRMTERPGWVRFITNWHNGDAVAEEVICQGSALSIHKHGGVDEVRIVASLHGQTSDWMELATIYKQGDEDMEAFNARAEDELQQILKEVPCVR